MARQSSNKGARGSVTHATPPEMPARSRIRRVFRVVGIALVVALGLSLLSAGYLVHRYESLLGRASLLAPGSRAGANGAVTGPLNLLLLGSDLRAKDPQAGQRADTIIIAHVNRSLDHVYLISVPRDLRVTIPADPAQGFAGETAKINAAFEHGNGGHGGAQLVSATIGQLMGIGFAGAASVDFAGLKGAVDVLGGVQLCVDQRVVSVHTHAVFEPGCRLMPSTEVLDYLRQRGFDDGDFTRQRHQQQFLRAVVDRAEATGVLTNPTRLDALLRAIAPAMTVDSGGVAPTDLVLALRGVRGNAITGIKIPSHAESIDGTSYVVATPEAPALYEALRTDNLEAWAKANPRWVNAI